MENPENLNDVMDVYYQGILRNHTKCGWIR